jgi:hypothetical protein
MPCPFFEPRRVAVDPQFRDCRLPLIDEYEGSCHATAQPFPAPAEQRFRCCNHGYSLGACPHFPGAERSGYRYSIIATNESTIDLLFIEERQYAPLRWQSVRFFFVDQRMEPEVEDVCARAQITAFCQSYSKRFHNQSSL